MLLWGPRREIPRIHVDRKGHRGQPRQMSDRDKYEKSHKRQRSAATYGKDNDLVPLYLLVGRNCQTNFWGFEESRKFRLDARVSTCPDATGRRKMRATNDSIFHKQGVARHRAKVLRKPDLAGRMVAWSVQLSEFDISFERSGHVKAQALANFLTKLTPGETLTKSMEESTEGEWYLLVDGSSNQVGSGVEVILEGPTGSLSDSLCTSSSKPTTIR
ncbi:hypothetical protein CR513_39526, partial [Mucuna pruriens]